ncbi:MAG: hypothetical protein J1E99_04055 [Muribaculaceae bacterium]|nr:hypothetical protein [Muribaculaceae bacterium]
MKKTNQNNSSKPLTIEQEIALIFKSLRSTLHSGMMAEMCKPSKNQSSCKGIIDVYRAEDLQKKEKNGFKIKPMERYAFYADIYNPKRIGSVAIYGDNAVYRYDLIRAQRFFFGRRIVGASVQIGLRPYVDVKLVA